MVIVKWVELQLEERTQKASTVAASKEKQKDLVHGLCFTQRKMAMCLDFNKNDNDKNKSSDKHPLMNINTE